MSIRSKFTTAIALASVLASCSDPGVISFRPSPSRMPDPITPVVGSSPTYGVAGHPTPSATPRGLSPQPTGSPRVAPPTGEVCCSSYAYHGTASTYGPGYQGHFALPKSEGGSGQMVTVCNDETHRCLTLISTDVGPQEWTHRVADLDVRSFEFLCDCDWTVGLQTVTVEFVD